MTREEAMAELNVLHERLSNPRDCEDGCYSWEDGWYVEAIDMAIEALHREEAEANGWCHRIYPLPSARPTGEWIPCEERLPKRGEHRDDMVLVCYRNGSVRFNTCMNGEWVQGSPIAWMPLPEPYKGGDSE